MPVKVILWFTPRSVSTAFERAIQQANDVKIIHEPYAKAFWFGPDKKVASNRYMDKIDKDVDVDLYLSYEDVRTLIKVDHSEKNIFIKANPFAAADCVGDFLNEELLCIHHTFLIRSPEKAFKSFYRVCMIEPLTPEFDATFLIMCYEKQFEFFNLISEKLDRLPVIIDADDLLNNPEKILREYCTKTGLTFHENMLKWEIPGNQIERMPWKAYHEVALKAGGFLVPRQNDYSFIPGDIIKYIEECISKCQESYNTLYHKRLKI